MKKRKSLTHLHIIESASGIQKEPNNILFESSARYSILCFKTGSLHAEFPDCCKSPGIYGTLFTPIQLLDMLHIKNGLNISVVRFAAQFRIKQYDLDQLLTAGKIFALSQELLLYMKR